MEKPTEVYAENFAEIFDHLEDVYGNAQWALRFGATKEDLLDQITQALELHQDRLLKDGWLIRSDAEAADGQTHIASSEFKA